MASLPKTLVTPEEYLTREREAETRSEFFAGEIFAMAGASEEHNTIAFNVAGELHSQLKGRPCRGYSGDMRVRVSETGLYTYPDVVIVCGEPLFEDERRDTLLNPTLIVEVLSPTTEAYDRGEKFIQYRRLESLREYVLIAQNRIHIERFLRQPDQQWLLSEASNPDDVVVLSSIGCQLALSDVYDRVELVESPSVFRDERVQGGAR
jgi:Uma2 family endonuclease